MVKKELKFPLEKASCIKAGEPKKFDLKAIEMYALVKKRSSKSKCRIKHSKLTLCSNVGEFNFLYGPNSSSIMPPLF